jgi:hypothetical protein
MLLMVNVNFHNPFFILFLLHLLLLLLLLLVLVRLLIIIIIIFPSLFLKHFISSISLSQFDLDFTQFILQSVNQLIRHLVKSIELLDLIPETLYRFLHLQVFILIVIAITLQRLHVFDHLPKLELVFIQQRLLRIHLCHHLYLLLHEGVNFLVIPENII